MRYVLFSLTVFLFSVSFFVGTPVIASETEGTIDSTYKYTRICKDTACSSYGNVNWKPTGSTAVSITDSGLTGYIWGDEIGWVDLNPTGAGVSIDAATGALSGYAYAAGGSWINFNPTDVSGGTDVGVSIDSDGEFTGWAWVSGAYGGWMNFDCASSTTCVKTDWRPTSARTTVTTDDSSSSSGGGKSKKPIAPSGKVKKLLPTSPDQTLLIGPRQVFVGDTVELVIITYDAVGTITKTNDLVGVLAEGANHSYTEPVSAGNGIYRTSYVATASGVDVVTASVNGTLIGSDSDGVDDGQLHITVKDRNKAKNEEIPDKAEDDKSKKDDKDKNTDDTTDPLEFEYGLTETCNRAFTWNWNIKTKVYRTVGDQKEKHVATLNKKSPWYIDIESIVGSDITYRFVFGDDTERSVVFTADDIADCLSVPDAPPDDVGDTDQTDTDTDTDAPDNTGTTTDPVDTNTDTTDTATTTDSTDSDTTDTTDTNSTTTTEVFEEDIDGDGNNEQMIDGIYQDTDGSSVPLVSTDTGVLIDTNEDDLPDTFWSPGVGTSSVITAGDRTYINDSSVSGNDMYEPYAGKNYNVILRTLTSGKVALAAESGILNTYIAQVTDPETLLPFDPVTRAAVTYAGLFGGLLVRLFTMSRVPFSLTDIKRMLVHSLFKLFGFFALHRRKNWGVVYDSKTKAPLDLAHVRVYDQVGKYIGETYTDIEGRYGFEVPDGNYTIHPKQDNYTFPSEKLSGYDKDSVYDNLYFGELLTVKADEKIVVNIPMDSSKPELEESTKRHWSFAKLDPFILLFAEVVFYFGLALVVWQLVVHPTFWHLVLALFSIIFLSVDIFIGRPHLYGSVRKKDGGSLAYGLIMFSYDSGMSTLTRVLDARGRYLALLPEGTFNVTISERISTDQYKPLASYVIKKKKDGAVSKQFTV